MIFAEITKRNYMSVSVTLKSYFYEVLIPSSQKNTSSPIEDILHHVSISFMKKLALYKCFNPRTHTGCDSSGIVTSDAISSFNPRTHTGCDPACKSRLNRKFQVSIHAPTRGATLPCLDSSWPLPRFQSTHPHGVRLFSVSSISIPSLFQSTHPHGVRLWPSIPR